MFNSKYSNFLTILLVIIIIAVIGILIFLGKDIYTKYIIDKESSDAVSRFQDSVATIDSSSNTTNELTTEENTSIENPFDATPVNYSSSTKETNKYKGYDMVGTIEIPTIDLKYPILGSVSAGSIEVAVAVLSSPGLNEPGNTTIIGHNYRNGLFFSNNKKLKVNNIIYITDLSKRKITYKIYDIFTTTPEDATYMGRETNGAREISLSTCTNDSKERLIILAKET